MVQQNNGDLHPFAGVARDFEIVDTYRQLRSIKATAEKLGLQVKDVKVALRVLGTARERRELKAEAVQNKLRSCYNNLMTDYQIARDVGCSVAYVRNWRKAQGLAPNLLTREQKKLARKARISNVLRGCETAGQYQILALLQMMPKGLRPVEIAARLKFHSLPTLYRTLKRMVEIRLIVRKGNYYYAIDSSATAPSVAQIRDLRESDNTPRDVQDSSQR
jgi:DNA-binding CsgD family transcriptional regulator